MLDLCKAGDDDACERLGLARRQRSAVQDPHATPPSGTPGLSGYAAKAAARCETGSGEDCYITGHLLEQGEYAPLDLDRATQYYVMGCRAGDVGSCQAAAKLYESGRVTLPTTTALFDVVEGACALKHAPSCAALGAALEASNINDALAYFERACKLGNGDSCGRAIAIESSMRRANELRSGLWFCWSGINLLQGHEGQCYETTEQCEQARQDAAAGLASSTACRTQKNAACFGADSAMAGERVSFCLVSLEVCNDLRGFVLQMAKKSRDYTNIGKCAALPRKPPPGARPTRKGEGDRSGA